MKRERYWAVVMNWGEIAYTWDKKHPKDKRKEKTVKVYAIYPKKKDAIADVKFRGGCKVMQVNIVAM